jgi:flagellar assembly protein FliH
MTNSTVIKADAMRSHAGRIQAFNLNDYQAQADAMLAKARAEANALAERIRKAAEVRAAELFEKRRREGLETGLAEGREKGRAEALAAATDRFDKRHASVVSSMQAAIESIDAHRREWLSAVHRDAVELALEIAQRVVKRVGAIERETAVANLRELIERVVHGRDLTIHVHPDDAATIRQFAASLDAASGDWRHARIVEDATVDAGGCRVDTDGGALDARLMTQLDRIADELVPWRNAAS